MLRVAVLGECMIELSQLANNEFKLGFGGDTSNTAIYLARCHGEADYFTALSDDTYSQQMIQCWQEEGVGTQHVKIQPNQLPGLYIINNDSSGERFFSYWRQNSPARSLLSVFPEVFDELKQYPIIFLSGITLSLYSQQDRNNLFAFLADYRAGGGIVAFDNNYRERNWQSIAEARQTFNTMMQLTDWAVISFDDEKSLYGEHSVDECINRWAKAGAKELVVKNGHHGCTLYAGGEVSFYPVTNIVKPVDTTAAGDSFNGAFLAAKLQGRSAAECIEAGQLCAATVIMHKGAIIDKAIDLSGGRS
ncbi:sugar kinase [Alteromonas aestuariivivens]|uniref:2-dehydro-3-deoxygluconokinase n=1 Tax=Alteromonas aestuariivivens TaxID=1938339 RepID=A0A3D8M6W7_9ALTE|nr:sugar kinase [Alteromonas aestuariivivens]RDV25445.1 sugar kinase [Alteromonas aestuariivivens]